MTFDVANTLYMSYMSNVIHKPMHVLYNKQYLLTLSRNN